MASLEQLETALRNADAAGDVGAARALTAEIIKVRGSGGIADIAKSAGTGLVKGAIGLAGLPGDASDAIYRGIGAVEGFVRKQFGETSEGRIAREARTDAAKAAAPNMMPTASSIRGAVEGVTGKFYEPQTRAGEYAQTVGEFAPGMLIGGGGGGLASRALTNVVAPAVGSEFAGGMAKGTAYEPYARVAGALVGGMAPSMASRAITPLPTSPERQAVVDMLRREGVQPTAGQATGRKALQYAESTLGDAPFAGGKASSAMERTGDQFTNAVSRSFGGAGRATPEAIDSAFTRIGQQFDDLAARNVARIDRPFINALKGTIDDYQSMVAQPNRIPAVENFATEIVNATTKYKGALPGDVYQSLTSRLEKAARGMGYSTPGAVEAQQALRGMRSTLDDMMERSIAASGNTADLGAWRAARGEYKNLLDVSRASTGAGENAAAGIVSPGQMRSALTRTEAGRRNYARGRGDLSELTRAGNKILTPLPQSGTAPRAMAQSVGPAMAAGGVTMLSGFPMTGAAMIAGAAAPGVAGRALMSRPVQAYLANQLLSGRPATKKAQAAVVNALLSREVPPASLADSSHRPRVNFR